MGKSNKVYIEKCTEYNKETIRNIITKSLEYLNIQLPEEKKVLVKPNVLGAYKPEECVTTHPIIAEAVIELLMERNNSVVMGDSSGIRIHGGTSLALKKSGLKALEEKFADLEVKSFEEIPSTAHTSAAVVRAKELRFTGIIEDVDCVINLPKLKSHQLTKYTGAVKNLFGCIPGGAKQQCHFESPAPSDFSQLLVDIYSLIEPKLVLNIMDGIMGIEGEGPGPSGDVKEIGLIAVSENAVALDIACCEAVSIKPMKIYTNKFGVQRGFSTEKVERNFIPEPIAFKVPFSIPIERFTYKFSALGKYKPKVIEDICKKCGYCAKVCPAECITMNGLPEWNYKECIYCYCCHENCPHKAIKLEPGFFLRIFEKFGK